MFTNHEVHTENHTLEPQISSCCGQLEQQENLCQWYLEQEDNPCYGIYYNK